ncbi:MAG TPA: substrate-binding domain-containing protein [Herpetosiphonaceae bacterium]
MEQTQYNSLTIGVFDNRQVYEGSTIARYEQTLLRGIRAAADHYGCNILLACGIGPHTAPFVALPAWPISLPYTNFVPVGPWNTAGLIAIPPFTDDQLVAIRAALPPDHPLVFTYPQEGFSSVGPANRDGIAQAFAHLIEHGHRRIAFMAADEHLGGDAAERLAAYQDATQAHGLPFDPALVAYGGHEAQQAYTALRRMLQSGIDFTAVLASNDESAIGVMRALADSGRQVPQDVAVIGFDDVLYAKGQTPPLTTVRHPTFELGYRAVEVLLDSITGARAEVETVRVPTRLIIRESCGCQPYSTLGISSRDELLPGSASPRSLDAALLSQAIADAVAVEAQGNMVGHIRRWAEDLAAAFQSSLALIDPAPFTLLLDRLLREMETAGEDVYAWQAAISVLRNQLETPESRRWSASARQLAENLIDHARVRISERLRRQHTRFLVQQAELTDRLGTMTTRLLTALDPQQILDILADHLPEIGIQHAHIALFEAEDEDAVAWSKIYLRSAAGPPALRRFPSREFPPLGLYPVTAPFRLALLPLIIEDGPAGFVAFDAAYLEPLALIVRHLAAAFRSTQLHAAAEEGRRQAEAANRLKSRFLSTVSHELRTPLNLIVGLSDMLLRERDGDRSATDVALQDLQRIYVNAHHLGQLIGDVLDLASSEAGQLRLYQEPLDLVEVLKPVIATGAQLAQEKGLAWHADIPPGGVPVRGDRTRLRQVALNLISNAVKFTERGWIRLKIAVADAHVTVAISDTGPGVPLADQQHIFDEFRASQRTAERGYGGLGLGLAICKHLLERHDGTIGVRSSGDEDGGATFFFTLPLIAADTLRDVSALAPAADHIRIVWLTERDAPPNDLAALLRERRPDLEVLRIDVATEWLPQVLAAPPAAVVLDEPAAARHGWEILSTLKRHPATAHLPVLMYALDPQVDRGALLDLDYLLKPLGPEHLAQVLDQQLLGEHSPSSTRTILIADDDPDILALHTRLVRQLLPESRILQARNGREALRLMEQARPQLVLLDLMMPQLDGFGVLEAMRLREATRNIPVVVLTSQTLTEDDIARLNAGVAAILSKGLYSADEILQHIEAVLVHQRRLGSPTQQIVRRAVAYIHTHYAEAITRDQLALYLGVSPDHLTASFRKEMGLTPIAYLNRYRISRAQTLLTESARSITEVALAVGFSDLTNFSRTFHREVGMTPNAFRRMRAS